jgi:hypothetical protein
MDESMITVGKDEDTNTGGTMNVKRAKKYTLSSSSSSSSSSDSENDKGKTPESSNTLLNMKPNFPSIKAISGQRIRVCTASGNIYETDRYCPHKRVDLMTKVRSSSSPSSCLIWF